MNITEKRYYQHCLGCQGPDSNNFYRTCPTCLKSFRDDMTGDEPMTNDIKEKISNIITNYEKNSEQDKEDYTLRAREIWENMAVATRRIYESEVAQLMQHIEMYNKKIDEENADTEDENNDSENLFIDQRGG